MESPHIGVFDSGFGGLTVLRALLARIPGARYTYLGDTARLPYGAKSPTTIARYAVESARFLASQGCEHLVIACNTASALALNEIRAAVPIPVTGVIEPGARAASVQVESARALTREVLVLATAATVASHAYAHECEKLGLQAVEKACPLLVPLIEEGWVSHPVTREVIRIYFAEALATGTPSAVLLGCTHYPLIAGEIQSTLRQLGHAVPVVDSAESTADAVAETFLERRAANVETTFTCFATDSVEKFERLGSSFLQRPLGPVRLLDLGG